MHALLNFGGKNERKEIKYPIKWRCQNDDSQSQHNTGSKVKIHDGKQEKR